MCREFLIKFEGESVISHFYCSLSLCVCINPHRYQSPFSQVRGFSGNVYLEVFLWTRHAVQTTNTHLIWCMLFAQQVRRTPIYTRLPYTWPTSQVESVQGRICLHVCVCVFVVRVIVKTSSHCGDLEIGRGVWHSSVLECVSTALVEKFHLFTFSFPFHLLYLPPTAPPLCLSLNANSIFI